MKKTALLTAGIIALEVISASSAAAQTSQCEWEGDWETSRGALNLTKSEEFLTGNSDTFGSVSGIAYMTGSKCEFHGVFRNSVTSKQGEFKLKQNGTLFSGQWNDLKGRPWAHSWTGSRSTVDEQTSISSTDPYEFVRDRGMSGQVFEQAQITMPQGSPNAILNPNPSEDGPTVEDVQELEDTLAALEAKKKEEKIAQAVRRLRAIKKGKWEVELEALCAWRASETDRLTNTQKEDYYGIGWVRARVIHKITKKQIDLAPLGGFANVNGDKERVWEIKPNAKDHLGVNAGDCTTIRRSFTYEVDFVKYGYDSLVDFLDEPKNRFDVMFKLTEHDTISADDYLGTKRAATSFRDSNFCNICGDYGKIPKYRNNQGMLNGFKDEGTKVSVAYGIFPDYDLSSSYYSLNTPERGFIRRDVEAQLRK